MSSNLYRNELPIFLLLLSLAFLISYLKVSETGPLWPDASQYANAGAMVHDYLRSGKILHPYSFAKENYYQYPAFHIPYHPPVYPGLLGLFFLITGVGYQPARFFIALCLAIVGFAFYRVLKQRDLNTTAAASGAMVLMSTHEIALWSRDTMSEIPALALMTTACWIFLYWLRTMKLHHFLFALMSALGGFLSRYLSVGVLLAWPFWVLLLSNFRAIITKRVVLVALVFGLLAGVWVLFALQFSKFETPLGGVTPKVNYVRSFSLTPVSYQLRRLPLSVGWPVLIVAIAGSIQLVYARLYSRFLFWFSWLACCLLLSSMLGVTGETRYFLFAIPSLAGVFGELLHQVSVRRRGTVLTLAIVAVCLLVNGYQIKGFPRGVVGYEAVGRELAGMTERGNVLVALAEQADLIFRFRSHVTNSDRLFIRADRTLVIRPPEYADAETRTVARTNEDVLEIIRRGRIRYLVTCNPAAGSYDDRTEEMITLDNLARSQPQHFQLLKTFVVLREYSRPGTLWQVSLWTYLGELPQTPSELPVIIPSADMELKPPSPRSN